jgi:hypothetical protein
LSPLHARPPPTCRSDRANTLSCTRTFQFSARAARLARLIRDPSWLVNATARRAKIRQAPRPLFSSVICPAREMYGISMMGRRRLRHAGNRAMKTLRQNLPRGL